jgi:hypothetical protein
VANANKRKGDLFEVAIQRYLSEAIDCERIPAGATIDRGDLWTQHAVIQCKNCKTWNLGLWLRETIAQQLHSRKPLHALVIKRPRTTDPSEQYVVMTLQQFRSLLQDV